MAALFTYTTYADTLHIATFQSPGLQGNNLNFSRSHSLLSLSVQSTDSYSSELHMDWEHYSLNHLQLNDSTGDTTRLFQAQNHPAWLTYKGLWTSSHAKFHGQIGYSNQGQGSAQFSMDTRLWLHHQFAVKARIAEYTLLQGKWNDSLWNTLVPEGLDFDWKHQAWQSSLTWIWEGSPYQTLTTLRLSKTSPLDLDAPWSIRDSTLTISLATKISHPLLNNGLWSIQLLSETSQMQLQGLRHENNSIKRFSYWELGLDHNRADVAWIHRALSPLNLTASLQQWSLKIHPTLDVRTGESLSGNRLLRSDLSGILGQAFYRTSYRLSGEVKAWMTQVQWNFPMTLKHTLCTLKFPFTALGVQADLKVRSEQKSLFFSDIQNDSHIFNAHVLWSQPTLALQWSPASQQKLHLKISQLLPLYAHWNHNGKYYDFHNSAETPIPENAITPQLFQDGVSASMQWEVLF